MTNYWKWIADHQPTNPRGMCVEMTKQMAEAFPELQRVRGHYICPFEGRRSHWWLVGPSGQIIDPTAEQYASLGQGDYEEYAGPEPNGRCLNCGALLFGEAFYVCDEECGRQMVEHCLGGGEISVNGKQVFP